LALWIALARSFQIGIDAALEALQTLEILETLKTLDN